MTVVARTCDCELCKWSKIMREPCHKLHQKFPAVNVCKQITRTTLLQETSKSRRISRREQHWIWEAWWVLHCDLGYGWLLSTLSVQWVCEGLVWVTVYHAYGFGSFSSIFLFLFVLVLRLFICFLCMMLAWQINWKCELTTPSMWNCSYRSN